MKKLVILFSAFTALLVSAYTYVVKTRHVSHPATGKSIYDFSINQLEGKTKISLKDFKGKKILFVNTASKCGYTPQYEGLQKLSQQYKDKLVVIGFPCNQFMGQEPGTANEIEAFCKKNYGVTFLLTEKIDVKGKNQHPIYQWLCQKNNNGVADYEVKWNFNKFLVNEEGKLIGYFESKIKPDDAALNKAIQQ